MAEENRVTVPTIAGASIGWLDDGERLVCGCGNTQASSGFDPCDLTGEVVEPTTGSWDGTYRCNDCGTVYWVPASFWAEQIEP